MVPTILFSILSYHYVVEIVKYRNLKNKEVYEALELINQVEEILSLPTQDFLNNYKIKSSIPTISNEATVHIFEYQGYDFVYIEE
jgi:hypothetical protein